MAPMAATKNRRTPATITRKSAPPVSFDYLNSGTDGYFCRQSMTARGK